MKKTPAIIIGTVVVVIALVAIVAASSGKKNTTDTAMSGNTDSSSTSASTSNAVAADKVTIANYMFGPADIKVKVGTTVTWTNTDSVKHNIVSDDNMMPDGKLIGKGEAYTYTFTKSGTYKYHCSPHPYMHGSVVVE
ncbi:MAG: plastocyanin/azurin family copper-binding protein [Patescibacteria group bacterium]|nr:plastocyanin/azurin family copper-binding protein [Patescibacteria group bacterium]